MKFMFEPEIRSILVVALVWGGFAIMFVLLAV